MQNQSFNSWLHYFCQYNVAMLTLIFSYQQNTVEKCDIDGQYMQWPSNSRQGWRKAATKLCCTTLQSAVLNFCNVLCAIVCTPSSNYAAMKIQQPPTEVIGVTNFITFRVTLQGCGVINFHPRVLWDLLFCNIFWQCWLGCFRKTLFRENQKYNPSSNSLGVSLKGSKRFFDFDKV